MMATGKVRGALNSPTKIAACMFFEMKPYLLEENVSTKYTLSQENAIECSKFLHSRLLVCIQNSVQKMNFDTKIIENGQVQSILWLFKIQFI